MKKFLKTIALLTLAAVIAFGILVSATAEEYKGIYQNTVRLHILADSDEPNAQRLKLKVRDTLIDYLTPLVSDCTNRVVAEKVVLEALPTLEKKAEETLRAEGCTQPVRVALGEEYYPTRKYEDCAYPAGEYLSLRVFIGSGEGKNWWCVIYPPLCLSASSASGGHYTEEEQEILDGEKQEYKVKFAFLEWGAKLKRLFG